MIAPVLIHDDRFDPRTVGYSFGNAIACTIKMVTIAPIPSSFTSLFTPRWAASQPPHHSALYCVDSGLAVDECMRPRSHASAVHKSSEPNHTASKYHDPRRRSNTSTTKDHAHNNTRTTRPNENYT
ncbi:hypothetical protein FOZ62_000048, partial [Perkinsus olseni]